MLRNGIYQGFFYSVHYSNKATIRKTVTYAINIIQQKEDNVYKKKTENESAKKKKHHLVFYFDYNNLENYA